MSTKSTFAQLRPDDGDDAFDFIGRSARPPAQTEPVGEPVPAAAVPEPAAPPLRLRQISARIDADLYRRLKLALASTGEEQQDLIGRLLANYVDEAGV